MPAKMARSAPRSPFGLPEATAVVRVASLSCQNEGKRQNSPEIGSHLGNLGLDLGEAHAARACGGLPTETSFP